MRESRTAIFTTLWRGLESVRPAATRLFEDRFATQFLSRRLRFALRIARLPGLRAVVPWRLVDGHWAGPRGTVAVRTRYIDDALREELDKGLSQVVILGAGFDTRAYRIPRIDRTTVFEVDHEATQRKKTQVMTRIFGGLPAHIVCVAMDFTRDTLQDEMLAARYNPGARTFFVCEGLTHYLPSEIVDALFHYISAAAVGSQVVFTYLHRGILDGSARFAGANASMRTVRRAGEPYTFGFDPAEVPAYLARRGFSLIEDIGASELRHRYLTPLGRGRMKLSEFQRIARAEVRGGGGHTSGD